MMGLGPRTRVILIMIHWPTRQTHSIQLPHEADSGIVDLDIEQWVYRTHIS